MELGSELMVCGHRWTTGTGPDDPDDTGIHVCAYSPRHDGLGHYCRCGENLRGLT